MQLILPKSSQKQLRHPLAFLDTQARTNQNHGPTLHIQHKKKEMPLWKLPAPSKAVISNGSFSLRSKISAFAVHPKTIKLKNAMHLKKEEEEPSLKAFKITMQDLSL